LCLRSQQYDYRRRVRTHLEDSDAQRDGDASSAAAAELWSCSDKRNRITEWQRNMEQRGIRMLWHHRQLIRKHRATRTTMVILMFPHFLSRQTRLLGLVGQPVTSLTQLVMWIDLLEFALHVHDCIDTHSAPAFSSVVPATTLLQHSYHN